MRKFLSLVLALVMMMSLITINTSAVEFKDGEDITYDEAVDVISTIHVVDGYPDGSFNPTGNLTRGAAAKIICNMILGPTTASQLNADTAPFRDVPVTHDFAGYIAYCQKEGIISGYGDGNFYPAGSLTGNAFMKMLLGALGYDAEIEQYVGPNWTINVAKRAIGIGLVKGLADDAFNGSRLITREEACLYAFNTLQADLVEYSSKITANVNGAEVTVGNSNASSREWTSQQTRIDYIRDDTIIQFAEEYFNKLQKKPGDDDFMRPAYTWIYDKDEIGTYVNWEIMVEEYTSEVSGRDLYDLLGSTTLRDNEVVYYVDGEIPNNAHPLTDVRGTDINDTNKAQLLSRSNDEGVGTTGNGILTQVFLDKEKEIITITSIETWLAKATADYNEDKEYAPVNVFDGLSGNPRTTQFTNFQVDVEDVPAAENVKEEDMYLVNITYKYNANGTVVEIAEPEVMDESVVTKFSKSNSNIVDKLTTDGTEYKHAFRAYFSDDALEEYDNSLLTDKTYNIYMDPYGYAIGVELHEGTKNYVFITGFDRPTSNLSISTATAAGIFLDGTMDTITVNVTDTNKNIDNARASADALAGKDAGLSFFRWSDDCLPGEDGSFRLNRWYTYSVNEAGVYTLKPAVRMTSTKYADKETIKTATVYVDDNVIATTKYPYGSTTTNHADTALPHGTGSNHTLPATSSCKIQDLYDVNYGARSYGNDDSVYLVVDMDIVDTSPNAARAISEVNGVYTGVQNVEIDVIPESNAEEAEVYTVYDKNHYIIGAVVVGEAKGGNATIAYVLGGAKSEELKDGVYYWEFEAVVDGEIKTMTAKSKYRDIFDTLKKESGNMALTASEDVNLADGIVELRFDADGEYVVSVKAVAEEKIYNQYGSRANGTYGTWSAKDGDTVNTVNHADRKRLSDMTVYRIGVLAPNDLGTELTTRTGSTTASIVRNGAAVSLSGRTYGPEPSDTVNHYYDNAPSRLYLQGRTLYVTPGQQDEGLALTADAKAVVIQPENGVEKKTEWGSVANAVAHLGGVQYNDGSRAYDGGIVAKLNSAGAAEWVVFLSNTNLVKGNGNNWQTPNVLSSINNLTYNDVLNKEWVGFNLVGTNPGEKYTVTMQITVPNTGVVVTRQVTVTGAQGVSNTRVPMLSVNEVAFEGALQEGTVITLTCGGAAATGTIGASGTWANAFNVTRTTYATWPV